MKISRLGETCFKISISLKERERANIIVDPFDGLKWTGLKADILLFTPLEITEVGEKKKASESLTGFTELKEKIRKTKGAAFLIEGPGEYEVKGIFIQGIEIPKNNKDRLTIYTIEAKKMRTCYLGDFVPKELSSEQIERIGPVDILIIPVTQALSPKEMQKIISQIEPRLVVAVERKAKPLKIKLKEFLREMGVKKIEEKTQVVLKKQDLKEEGMDIIVLSA